MATGAGVVVVRIDRARAAAAIGTDAYLAGAAADFASVAAITAASGDPGARGYTASALVPDIGPVWVQRRVLPEIADSGGRRAHPAYWAPFVLVDRPD